MNETIKAIKDHLLFLIELETKTMFDFDLQNNEKMRRNCSITRSAYLDIYDYVMRLQAEEDLEKEVK